MHVRVLYMALRRSAGSLVSLHPLVILVFTSLPPIYHAPHLEAAKSLALTSAAEFKVVVVF